jgi:hypothetical protein
LRLIFANGVSYYSYVEAFSPEEEKFCNERLWFPLCYGREFSAGDLIFLTFTYSGCRVRFLTRVTGVYFDARTPLLCIAKKGTMCVFLLPDGKIWDFDTVNRPYTEFSTLEDTL